jgi:hypothetical protein
MGSVPAVTCLPRGRRGYVDALKAYSTATVAARVLLHVALIGLGGPSPKGRGTRPFRLGCDAMTWSLGPAPRPLACPGPTVADHETEAFVPVVVVVMESTLSATVPPHIGNSA